MLFSKSKPKTENKPLKTESKLSIIEIKEKKKEKKKKSNTKKGALGPERENSESKL